VLLAVCVVISSRTALAQVSDAGDLLDGGADTGVSLMDAAPEAGVSPQCEPFGQRTDAGACVYPLPLCTDSQACPAGSLCQTDLVAPGIGLCTGNPECATDADCDEGLVCRPEPACNADNTCAMDGLRCLPPVLTNRQCRTDQDCGEGAFCFLVASWCEVVGDQCSVVSGGHCASVCGDPIDIYLPGEGCVLFEVPPGEGSGAPDTGTSEPLTGTPSTWAPAESDSGCHLSHRSNRREGGYLVIVLALLVARRRRRPNH
jgi:hypothetical protein